MKIAAEFPAISVRDTPTIAIITSLFCEKMAVDAMLESKVTYIKHAPDASTLGEQTDLYMYYVAVFRHNSSCIANNVVL